MSNVVQFPTPHLSEMFSVAFKVTDDRTQIIDLAFAVAQVHPNRRFKESFMRNAVKHVGNFYHQFRKDDRTEYVVGGVIDVDHLNRVSFRELQDITDYV